MHVRVTQGWGPNVCERFQWTGLTSWRVVIKQDIVPQLPPLFSYHVDTEPHYDSDNLVEPGFGFWHDLMTYLHLIDPS